VVILLESLRAGRIPAHLPGSSLVFP
jgi:hypothetical protein